MSAGAHRPPAQYRHQRTGGGRRAPGQRALSRPISKKDIFRVMEVINTVRLQAPTAVGQVALADVCGLGADDCHQKRGPRQRVSPLL